VVDVEFLEEEQLCYHVTVLEVCPLRMTAPTGIYVTVKAPMYTSNMERNAPVLDMCHTLGRSLKPTMQGTVYARKRALQEAGVLLN